MIWECAAEIAITTIAQRMLRDQQQLARFAVARMRYSEVCIRLLRDDVDSNVVSGAYDWPAWSAQLRAAFEPGVPFDFLWNDTLRRTMVFAQGRGIMATRDRLRIAERVFDDSTLRGLLREDCIGRPSITSLKYATSANRAHHVAHLAEYYAGTNHAFWEHSSILEWGGGYGNMARVLCRANPRLTYIIADLPEVLALQFVYLVSCEGNNRVQIVDPRSPSIEPHKINLLTSSLLLDWPSLVTVDAFVSTWALTESPPATQLRVAEMLMFGAASLLIASKRDTNNVLATFLRAEGVTRQTVPSCRGISADNDYWFRCLYPK